LVMMYSIYGALTLRFHWHPPTTLPEATL
jgi:hypothetical protein